MGYRTYVPTVLKAAVALCDAMDKWTPAIKLRYPDNTTLHDALDAAKPVCDALRLALLAVREYGD